MAQRLLFICTGNICRSLMAERMARKLAADGGGGLEVKSCGLAAETYFKPPKEVGKALEPLGIGTDGHVAQLISRDLLRWCDVALTMTRGQREAVLDAFPEFTSKVFVLTAYAGLPESDVPDPYGRAQPVFDACRGQLWTAVQAVLRRGA